MTLKELFTKVAVAMDEVDLRDYGEKVYECADSVQREVAVFTLPIIKFAAISCKEGFGDLAEDCYEPIYLFKNGKKVSFINNGNGTISAEDGEYRLKYNGYPQKITAQSSLNQSIEVAPEAAEAMVYGVCAGLCINDEPELYSAYMNRYNNILEAISLRRNKFPFAEVSGGITL